MMRMAEELGWRLLTTHWVAAAGGWERRELGSEQLWSSLDGQSAGAKDMGKTLVSGWGARLDSVPHTPFLEGLHVGGGVTLIY